MIDRLPSLLIPTLVFGLSLHGPIPQLPHYHDFADQRFIFGIAHGADVLSNLGFAIIGLYGLHRLWPVRHQAILARGWPDCALFFTALVLTAFGSRYYHVAPDDSRLVWDRLSIALLCAGLLAAVYAETRSGVDGRGAAIDQPQG